MTIVCLPSEKTTTISGSIVGVCSICRCGIWVSPSSTQIAGKEECTHICTPCFKKTATPEQLDSIQKLQPEQHQELITNVGKSIADQIEAIPVETLKEAILK